MSTLIFEGALQGNGAGRLFVWNVQAGKYESVALGGNADSDYVTPGAELGIPLNNTLLGPQGENYISGPDLLYYNSDVYMQAQGSDGSDLFVYDTANGKSWEVKGTSNMDPNDLTVFKGQVYFDAYAVPPNALAGEIGELYRTSTDGTSAQQVSGAPTDPSSMVVYNGDLLMGGQDSSGNFDLWSYNGGSGASSFKEIGSAGLNPTDMTVSGQDLFMNGLDGARNALYVYSSINSNFPTPKAVDAGPASSTDAEGNHGLDPLDILASPLSTNSEAIVYFSGVTDNAGDRALFVTKVQGSSASTQEIKGTGGGGGVSNFDPYDLTVFDGLLFFTGNDNNTGGRGLFVLNPSDNAFEEVLNSSKYNLSDGYNSSWGNLNPNTLTVEGGNLYFGASGPGTNNLPQLWELSITGSGASTHFSVSPNPIASSSVGLAPTSLTHT
jgi:hypothetical protein